MTFMLTATGHTVEISQPRPQSALSLATIAHHLAQINRFTGAARRPYSVAEHSLLVCDIAANELGLDVHGQLAALLHDAHEAIVGDASTPLKQCIGEPWYRVELPWQHAVQRAFAISVASTVNADAIKRADLMALAIERRDLLPAGGPAWPVLQDIPVPRHFTVNGREGLDWNDWRTAFSDRFEELDFGRTNKVSRIVGAAR